jgi:putative ABC transport system substrate-binding protein
MRRREFITFAGGAAVAWPLAVRAQQPMMSRIGVLVGFPEGDPEAEKRIEALLEALSQLGWKRDKNIHIDIRRASTDPAGMQQLAKELIELRPDLIQVTTTRATAVAGDAHHSGRVRRFGSYWLRIRRKFCSTRRQCDWIYQS